MNFFALIKSVYVIEPVADGLALMIFLVAPQMSQ
jgi:hypothetical protein